MAHQAPRIRYSFQSVEHLLDELLKREEDLRKLSEEGWEIKSSAVYRVDGENMIITDLQLPNEE